MTFSFDHYFMSVAQAVAKAGNCPRMQVGTVLTKPSYADHHKDCRPHIVATGYNSAPSLSETCLTHGCLLNELGRCTRTVHSEVMACDNMVTENTYLDDPEPHDCDITAYVTISPCVNCLEHMWKHQGVRRIVVGNPYRPSESREWCAKHKVELVELYEEIQPKSNQGSCGCHSNSSTPTASSQSSTTASPKPSDATAPKPSLCQTKHSESI